jgi:CheY-like chemotaxis protein
MNISERCQDPEELERTTLAFDQAWSIIESGFANDPTILDAMRLRLAEIILNSPATDLQDCSRIPLTSLQILASRYPTHAATIEQLVLSKADANTLLKYPLQGRSLLIVEDEPLIVMEIEQELADTGAEITVTTVLDHALLLVERGSLSAAILDHSIGDNDSSCLYDRLNERGIPFIIYSAHDLPEEHRKGGILISKPALPGMLRSSVNDLFRDG